MNAAPSPVSLPAALAHPGSGTKTYVLVHGAYHGGWCWDEVANRLRAAGHAVFAPTQTGLGERAHLIGTKPTLETFIEDVVQVIIGEDLNGVILVGHSFGGSTVSGVADRVPERLRHLVYLDALIIRDGEAPFDGLPTETLEHYERLARSTSGGLSVPPPDASYFGVTDVQQASWLADRLTPQPLAAYQSKLRLENPVGNNLPATYIACSEPFFAPTADSRAIARAMDGWSYLELRTAHDAMLTAPAEVAGLLLGVG